MHCISTGDLSPAIVMEFSPNGNLKTFLTVNTIYIIYIIGNYGLFTTHVD